MGFFSFLNAKVKLFVDNPIVNEGAKFTGNIKLNVKKELKTKDLSLELYLTTSSYTMSSKGAGNRSSTVKVAELLLAGEKEYLPGDYEFPFELVAPNSNKMSGSVGKVLNFVSGALTGRKSYTLKARLNIPWAFDRTSSAKVQINHS